MLTKERKPRIVHSALGSFVYGNVRGFPRKTSM